MTDEYNISDDDINAEIAKMKDQFVKLGKFLDDRTPKEKLETINKQIEQCQQEKYYLEREIALKSKEQHQQFINFFKEWHTATKKEINPISIFFKLCAFKIFKLIDLIIRPRIDIHCR